MMTVGGLTAAVKFVGAGRDLALAHQFGTRGEFDAYLIAYAIPSFMTNLIAGSLAATFVPLVIQARERDGMDAARQLFSATVVRLSLALLALTVALGVATRYFVPMLATGFTPGQLALAVRLSYVLVPTLALGGLSLTFGAVLNASGRFARVAVAPLLTPAVQLALVLTARENKIEALAYGTSAGALIEAVLLMWAAYREGYLPLVRGERYGACRSVFGRQYVAMIVGSALMGSTVIVDQSMAAMLGGGSVSALAFGTKVVSFLREIGPAAMSTVLLPHFSRLAADRDWDALRRDLALYSRIILAVSAPGTLIFAFFSRPIIALLFQRGAFTPSDTEIVSYVQTLFAIQIPFYMLGLMFVRVLSAFQANHLLMYGTAISVVVNIGLNLVFMKQLGVAGIALSTSGVYFVSCVYLAVMAWRLIERESERRSDASLGSPERSAAGTY
jgi:putative peptidoglycan lipid II flippase